ncbi:MAG: Ger(x)C family spore germination protein [Bacillota bacterium]
MCCCYCWPGEKKEKGVSLIKKLAALLAILFLALNSTGCWDLWEIEERGLVLGLGIDEIPLEEVADSVGLEGQLQEEHSNRGVRITYQFAIPAGLSGDEKGGEGPGFYNLTTSAPMSNLIFRGLAATRASRKADVEQLQVLILGEKLSRAGIFSVLDRLVRDPNVRKHVPVFVTQDDVAEVLTVYTKQDAAPAIYLAELMRNNDWAHRIAPEMRLGQVLRGMREKAVFVVPRVTVGEQDSKLAGAGVFYGDRLKFWLGEEETIIYRWVINEVEVSPIIATLPDSKSAKLINGYSASRNKTTIRPVIEDDRLKFEIKVMTKGELLERQSFESAWQDDLLKEIAIELAEILKKDMEALIKKTQQEWQLDIFDFGRSVERHYPQVWKDIKNDWHDQYYPAAEIDLEVNLTISRTGVLR